MSEIIDESKKIAGIMDLDLYLTDEELLAKDQEHYYQKGLEEGIQKGIEEGILQNKIEMVLNMNANKIPIETIAECAKLSISEINKIINNNL